MSNRHIIVVDADNMQHAYDRVDEFLVRYAPNAEFSIECILDLDTENVLSLHKSKIPEFMMSLKKLNEECKKYIVSENDCKRIINAEIKKDTVDWSLVKETALRAINSGSHLNPLTFDVLKGDELNAWEFSLFGVTNNDYNSDEHLFAVCVFID